MKVALWICAVGLLISAVLFGYALYESEPDLALYSGYLAVVAVAAPVLVLLYKLILLCAQAISSGATNLAESTKEKSEQRAARRAAKRAEQARAREEQILGKEKLQKEQSIRSNEVPPVPSHNVPAAPVPAQVSIQIPAQLSIPMGRGLRTTTAALALLAFLVFPQFELLVGFNGFRIMKFMAKSNTEAPVNNNNSWQDSNAFSEFAPDEADAGTPIQNEDGALTPIFIWIAMICLFLSPIVAFFAPIKADLAVAVIASASLIIVYFGMESTMSDAPADNPIAAGLMQAIGFTWGYLITVLLTLLHAGLAGFEFKGTLPRMISSSPQVEAE